VLDGVIVDVIVCEKEVDNELESVKEFVWGIVRLLEGVTVVLSLCVGDGTRLDVSDMDREGERGAVKVLGGVIVGVMVREEELDNELDPVKEFVRLLDTVGDTDEEFDSGDVRLLEGVTVSLSLCVGDGKRLDVSDMDKVGECDSVLLRVILGDDVWEREGE